MRVSEMPQLRGFWYCVAAATEVTDKPLGVRILGEAVVLWRDGNGTARAVNDRCLHRTAKLSLGTVENGHIVCPYHGWAFDGAGRCVRVPQHVEDKPNPFGVPGYHCTERYNHVWVSIETPVQDIPAIPEFDRPGYRQVIEFRETWAANPLRIIENSFDAAHISFVHKESFGDPDPRISPFTIDETDDGFVVRNAIKVKNAEHMKVALAMAEDETERRTDNRFFLPFSRVGRIRYPNGLEHILCTFLTPIDDEKTQFVQWVVRNDTEEAVRAADIIAFDRQVTLEDRHVLESTDLNVPLDRSEGVELHMASDKPGILMRKTLRRFAGPAERGGPQPAGTASAARPASASRATSLMTPRSH